MTSNLDIEKTYSIKRSKFFLLLLIICVDMLACLRHLAKTPSAFDILKKEADFYTK